MSTQARQKVAMIRAWNAARAGHEPREADALAAAYSRRWGPPGSHYDGARRVVAAKYLGVTQYPQQTSFYCGPASGYSLIRYVHGSNYRSRYDNSSLAQSSLANANHMRTDVYGATDWSRQDWVRGVNRWRGNSWYVQFNGPISGTNLNYALNYSVGAQNLPFGVATVEFAGGHHYNRHPDKLIGHWLTAYGFSEYGERGHYVDPATSVWPGILPKFSYSTPNFASRFLRTNGIAY